MNVPTKNAMLDFDPDELVVQFPPQLWRSDMCWQFIVRLSSPLWHSAVKQCIASTANCLMAQVPQGNK